MTAMWSARTDAGQEDVERRVHGTAANRPDWPARSGCRPRSPYARDRARVLHSVAVPQAGREDAGGRPGRGRRPPHPAHPLPGGRPDRPGHRARLGADPDLVDLAGLAHDIGHPPFGHNGEPALDGVGAIRRRIRGERPEPAPADLSGAEGARRRRPVGRAEPHPRRAGRGDEVPVGPTACAAGGKFGVYADEAEVFAWIRRRASRSAPRGASESQIMDWSDDVAYSVHDVEDGILAGRIDPARLRSDRRAGRRGGRRGRELEFSRRCSRRPGPGTGGAAGPAGDRRRAAGGGPTWRGPALATKTVTSELIGRFVTGAVAATRAVSPRPLRRYAGDLRVPTSCGPRSRCSRPWRSGT